MPTTPTGGAPARPAALAEPAAASRRTAVRPRDPRSERLRANLRQLLAEHDVSVAELGRRLGGNSANAFYNFLNGWSADLSHRTLARLCDAFPGITLDALTGRRSGTASTAAPAALPSADPADRRAAVRAALRDLRCALDRLDTALRGGDAAGG